MSKTKLNRSDTVEKIVEAVEAATNNPAEELITLGKTLIAVGEALDGLGTDEATAVMQSATLLLKVKKPITPEAGP